LSLPETSHIIFKDVVIPGHEENSIMSSKMPCNVNGKKSNVRRQATLIFWDLGRAREGLCDEIALARPP
jgi:hypothetical protein